MARGEGVVSEGVIAGRSIGGREKCSRVNAPAAGALLSLCRK